MCYISRHLHCKEVLDPHPPHLWEHELENPPKSRRPFHVCHDDLVVPDHASVEQRIKLKFKRSKLAEILSNAVMYMSCILDIDAWHILAYFVPRKPPKPFIFSDIIGLMTLHEALAQLVTSAKRRLHGSKSVRYPRTTPKDQNICHREIWQKKISNVFTCAIHSWDCMVFVVLAKRWTNSCNT
jgi:hypothetical protein